MDEHMQEILEYLEKERQRGLKIHQEMEKLVLEGKATNEQADDWLYYEGYADGIAAAMNKLKQTGEDML